MKESLKALLEGKPSVFFEEVKGRMNSKVDSLIESVAETVAPTAFVELDEEGQILSAKAVAGAIKQVDDKVKSDDLKNGKEDVEHDKSVKRFNAINKAIGEDKIEEGKDIGKPGKHFNEIAKKAAKEYHSKIAGERVAGAVEKEILAKESKELDEAVSNTLRKNVKDYAKDRGYEKYRITHDGKVEFYGKMPNTNKIGWFFAGSIRDFERWFQIHHGYTKEEVESIEELSKATLGNYLKKAGEKRSISAYQAGQKTSWKDNDEHMKDVAKRKKGMEMAVDKLTKEEVESTNEDMGARTIYTKNKKTGKNVGTFVVNKKRVSKQDRQNRWTALLKKYQPTD